MIRGKCIYLLVVFFLIDFFKFSQFKEKRGKEMKFEINISEKYNSQMFIA